MKKTFFLLIVLGSIFPQIINATTYYSDPVFGSMSNSGTSNAPWAALETIMSSNVNFDSGDTILLRDGNHGIVKINLENDDFVYILPQTGHQPLIKNIVFGSVNTTAFWQIEGLTIESVRENTSPIFLITGTSSATHINVINCTIQSEAGTENWSRDEWREMTNHGLLTLGGNCLIQGNTFKNIGLGMSIEGGTTDVISNTVENFTIDGIRMLSSNCLFEKNTVFNNIIVYTYAENHNDGFQSYTCCPVGSDTIENVIMRQNYVLNTTDTDRAWWGPMQGIAAFDGYFKNWVIENNIVITDHWHGITLLGAIDCQIINNTVIDPYDISAVDPNDPQSGGNLGPTWVKIGPHKDGSPSSGNYIRNNLTADLQTLGSGATFDNNIVIGPSSNYSNYFVDVDNLDLSLEPESSAVDTGSEELAPDVDFNGTPRPQGAGFDIGALEYNTLIATKEVELKTMIVFPNPASDYIILKDQKFQPESIKIFDVKGEMVLYKEIGNLSRINISNLSAGVYFLLIKSEKETFRSIFVKE